jgi:molybdenum storage protein
VLGAKAVIFAKDEDGLYTADPKKDAAAKFIPKIHVDELLVMDLGDLVIERAMLEYMKVARHVRTIQIVNGLKPGYLTRAVAGEHVGTIITAD